MNLKIISFLKYITLVIPLTLYAQPSVTINFGDIDNIWGSVEIYIDSDIPISTLQFSITGLDDANSIYGGLVQSMDLVADIDNGIVIIQCPIELPPISGLLGNIGFWGNSQDEICMPWGDVNFSLDSSLISLPDCVPYFDPEIFTIQLPNIIDGELFEYSTMFITPWWDCPTGETMWQYELGGSPEWLQTSMLTVYNEDWFQIEYYFDACGIPSFDDVGPQQFSIDTYFTLWDNSGIIGEIRNYQFSVTSKPGDINMDGSLNVQDIVIIIGLILASISENDYDLGYADLNDDDIVDVLDVVLLVDIILAE